MNFTPKERERFDFAVIARALLTTFPKLQTAIVGVGRALAGAVLAPLSGLAMAWLFCRIVDISRADQDILFVFGALPPAVTNFIFAERYDREPEKVAAIVAIGNAAAIVFIPIALALRM